MDKINDLEKLKFASEEYKKESQNQKEYEQELVSGNVSNNSKSSESTYTLLATREEVNKSGNPTGTIISYMGNNAPDGYLKCDGKEYKINDYKNLAEQIKNEFGSYNYFGGDGIKTFSVPDLQGEFLRGTGTNSHENQGSGENVGTHQNATWHLYVRNDSNCGYIGYAGFVEPQFIDSTNHKGTYLSAGLGNFSWSQNTWGSYTSRPTNTSILYCIKY